MSLPAAGGAATITVTTGPTCIWTASASALWVNNVPSQTVTGSGSVNFTVGDNSAGNPRATTLYVAGTAVSISQQGSTVTGLSFVPVPPCRLVDTRPSEGKTGPFGPPYLTGSATREIPVPSGSCSIPAYARAYSESALRAIIQCQPYNLPAQYFEEWKSFTPVFQERPV